MVDYARSSVFQGQLTGTAAVSFAPRRRVSSQVQPAGCDNNPGMEEGAGGIEGWTLSGARPRLGSTWQGLSLE